MELCLQPHQVVIKAVAVTAHGSVGQPAEGLRLVVSTETAASGYAETSGPAGFIARVQTILIRLVWFNIVNNKGFYTHNRKVHVIKAKR